MSTMELTVWGHAGIRLERDGRRLAIDPGMFTDPRQLDGVTAVLVTHEHPDHVVPDRLAPLVAERTDLEVWAPASVVDALVAAGAPAARVHAVSPGDELTAAGFEVRVVGTGVHAEIHRTIARIANAAYLVEGAVLHPGDSVSAPLLDAGVQVLTLPVSAPWLRFSDALDYVAAVRPAMVVPIHDAILSDDGRQVVDGVARRVLGELPYRRLAVGEPLTVTAG